MGRAQRTYQPRHAETSVLHVVIRKYLDDFPRDDGVGLPEFIAREFREFLTRGVLASHARWRAEVVASRRAERTGAIDPSEVGISIRMEDSGAERPRYWTWAALMRRAFDLDILRCPRCAGRMPRIATVDDPAVMRRILAHLGLPGARAGPPPPFSMTEAGAEQQGLPSVIFQAAPWAQAAAAVCPAAAWRPGGDLPPPASSLRFDLSGTLWQHRRDTGGALIRVVPRR